MIFYIAGNIVIYVAAVVFLQVVVGRKLSGVDRQLHHNAEMAKVEGESRRKLVQELADIVLGFVDKNELNGLNTQVSAAEEQLRAEKGRITITEAEVQSVDARLRELEEIKRELEISNMDAVKELDMLRSQENDVRSQNAALKEQLDVSLDQLEILLEVLESSAEAVYRLTNAKNELSEVDKKCVYFEEQSSLINMRYLALKKAYDALDIEYAQLYEKQQAAEYG